MEVDVDDKENTATSAPAKRRARDYNRTRLRPAIIIFEDFLDKLSASWKGKQLEESDKTGLLNFWCGETAGKLLLHCDRIVILSFYQHSSL